MPSSGMWQTRVVLNKYPALSAEAGMSEQKLSLKINGQFDDMKLKIKKQNIPFSKLNFPNLEV